MSRGQGLQATLSLHESGDAGVLWDEAQGFWQIIPSHPQLIPTADDAGPECDLLISCGDVPMELRYRLVALPAGEPEELAMEIAGHYSRIRSRNPLSVRSVAQVKRRAWGVSSAASVIYPLLTRDRFGATMEDLLVLVRPPKALLLTARFDDARFSTIARSFFDSCRVGNMRWCPGEERPDRSLWPESTFVEGGWPPQLSSETRLVVRELSTALAPLPTDLSSLRMRLHHVFRDRTCPFDTLSDDERDSWSNLLTDEIQHPELVDELRQSLRFVRTQHDLRGYSMMWLAFLERSGD